MHPTRWNRFESLFHAALNQPPSERENFLNEACADDPSLRRDLLSLLAQHTGSSSDILEATAERSFAAPVLGAGQRIAHFRIVRTLGQGGMARVYLAFDTSLEREVALKVVFDYGDPATSSRFLLEARAPSQLRHPNIVDVFERGQDGPYLYIASEYVAGGTLRARLDGFPLPFSEVVTIVNPLISALSAAHAKGIVHRDLKPENVMFTETGELKLVDFGIAKLTTTPSPDAALHTRPGDVLGTTLYMSPEQARGESVDARTDIWSLGVLLFELTVGSRPFQGSSSAHVLVAIQEASLPSNLTSLTSPSLAAVIRRALQKNREDRFQSVEEFAAAWNRLTTQAPPAPVRNPGFGKLARQTALVVLGVLLVLGAIRLVRAIRGPAKTVPFIAGTPKKLTNFGDVQEAVISPDGHFVAFVRGEAEGNSIWVRQIEADSISRIRPPTPNIDGSLTFSPDSQWIYYLDDPSKELASLYRAPTLGGEPSLILSDLNSPVAFSPSGRQIAFIRDVPSLKQSRLVTADENGSDERVVAVLHEPQGFSSTGLAWAPDGKSLFSAFASYRPVNPGMNIARISLNGSIKEILRAPKTWVGRVSCIGSGRRVLFSASGAGTLNRQLFEGDPNSGNSTAITDGFIDYPNANISQDGSSVVTVGQAQPSAIYVLGAEIDGVPRRITGPTGQYYSVAWSDPNRLVVTGGDSGESRITLLDAGGFHRQVLAGSTGADSKARASPDGRYLVFASNRLNRWHLWRSDLDGSHALQLTKSEGDDNDPWWSPDSQSVYFTSKKEDGWALLRVGKDGGAVSPVISSPCRKGALSSDGNRMVAECLAPADGNQWKVAWFDLRQTQLHVIPQIPLGSGNRSAPAQWVPGADILTFIHADGPASNLYNLDLSSGKLRKVTDFTDETIFQFAWSPQRPSALALIRGTRAWDAVLIPRKSD